MTDHVADFRTLCESIQDAAAQRVTEAAEFAAATNTSAREAAEDILFDEFLHAVEPASLPPASSGNDPPAEALRDRARERFWLQVRAELLPTLERSTIRSRESSTNRPSSLAEAFAAGTARRRRELLYP